jgi:hypothetical protein
MISFKNRIKYTNFINLKGLKNLAPRASSWGFGALCSED